MTQMTRKEASEVDRSGGDGVVVPDKDDAGDRRRREGGRERFSGRETARARDGFLTGRKD